VKKPSIDLATVTDLLVRHGEKIGVVVVGLGALLLVWGGVDAMRTLAVTDAQTPEAVNRAVAQARGHIGREVQPPADLLPFRLAFGRPMYSPDGETAAYLWIQGGRIRLRFATDGTEHRFAGELRTDRDGLFEDVLPTGENVRIRQLRPGKIFFDAQTTTGDDGLDVTLGGTFDQLTIDLRVDGEQRANLLRIGEDKRTPAALPARLELRKASPAWIERFGF